MNTKVIRIDPERPDPAAMAAAGDILRKGGLVAFPTETVYGLGADALSGEAAAKIYAAKGRPQDNPLIVHIAEPGELSSVAIPDPRAELLARAFWPGPLTVILPKKPVVPGGTTGGLATVAVRLPKTPAARALIRAAGVPIAAPSANASGRPSPTRAEHVLEDLGGKIDLVLDGGPCEIGLESTIVTLAEGAPRLLRPGAVTPEMLRAALGELVVDDAVSRPLAKGEVARAPGMKYRHYAPKAHLTLVRGTAQALRAYAGTLPEKPAILCFTGEEALFEGYLCRSYGPEHDHDAQARGLFAALRAFDAEPVAHILARCPDADGVGLAVFNRILKSAGYDLREVTG